MGSHRTEGWEAFRASPSSPTATLVPALPRPARHPPPPQRQERHRVAANPPALASAPSCRAPVVRSINWIIRGSLGRRGSPLDLEINPLPSDSALTLQLRAHSPAARFSLSFFFFRTASVIHPQTGETQQLLQLIVCMSTCVWPPCGGYCIRGVAAGGFARCWRWCWCRPARSPGRTVVQVSSLLLLRLRETLSDSGITQTSRSEPRILWSTDPSGRTVSGPPTTTKGGFMCAGGRGLLRFWYFCSCIFSQPHLDVKFLLGGGTFWVRCVVARWS